MPFLRRAAALVLLTPADPYLGGWVRHAQEHVPDGDALVWRDAMDLTSSERGDLHSSVIAVLNTAAMLRSGVPNPRCFYLPINPMNTASMVFAERTGARHVEGLDVQVGAIVHQCHVIDHGPDGVLGAQRATIYAELGLPRPTARPAPLPRQLMREVVVAAYRDRTASHEDVACTLHLSRATYFRRLRVATDRVCDYVLASLTSHASEAA